MRIILAVAFSLTSVLLGGCGAQRSVHMNPAYPSVLRAPDKMDSRETILTAAANDAVKRNHYIDQLVLLIDQNYRAYADGMYAGRAGFDTGHDMALLGINGATAMMGAAQTKAILGAISTGLVGAKASIDKNFFANASRDALFNKMDALRADALALIIANKKKTIAEYTMDAAFLELDHYYAVGTIQKALESINAASGTDKTTALKDQKTAAALPQQ